jgi:hypothetical protein
LESYSCSFLSFFFLQNIQGIIDPAFSVNPGFIVECILLLALLLLSGFVSGAETAFFSLTPAQLLELKDARSIREKTIYSLLSKTIPRYPADFRQLHQHRHRHSFCPDDGAAF